VEGREINDNLVKVNQEAPEGMGQRDPEKQKQKVGIPRN